MKFLTGGCRCRSACFEIKDVLDAGYCHCSQCRRRSGAPVFAFLSVQDAAFRWRGGQLISEPSEAVGVRDYCAYCRSEVCLRFENPEFGVLRAIGVGLLDEPALIRPTFHQFTADALPWLEIQDNLPRFVDNRISHPRERPRPFV